MVNGCDPTGLRLDHNKAGLHFHLQTLHLPQPPACEGCSRLCLPWLAFKIHPELLLSNTFPPNSSTTLNKHKETKHPEIQGLLNSSFKEAASPKFLQHIVNRCKAPRAQCWAAWVSRALIQHRPLTAQGQETPLALSAPHPTFLWLFSGALFPTALKWKRRAPL